MNLKTIFSSLSNLSKREKTIFYIAVIFSFLALLDRLIISPITLKIQNLNKEIKETELKIKNSLLILSQKEKILNESKKYESFLTNNKSDEEEITSLLKEIESIANKSSIYIVEMKPLPLKEEAFIKKYLVALSCEAQMENIVDFLYSIEDSNKLLIVERYQINPKSKESNIAQLTITISRTVIP